MLGFAARMCWRKVARPTTPIGSVCLNNNGYRLNNHGVSTVYPIMEILLVLRLLCLDA